MPGSNELLSHQHFPFINEGTPLQIVRWSGKRVGGSFTGSSIRYTLPSESLIVEIASTENCYIAFGDNTIDASTSITIDGSRLFLAGVQIVPVPLDSDDVPYTHLAVIQLSDAGVIQVEEVE